MADVTKNARLTTKFLLEIDGISIGTFEDCDISEASYTVIENRTGTDDDTKTQSKGLRGAQTIVIGKVARVEDNAAIQLFADWYEAGDLDKRGGRVDYVDHQTGVVFHREVFENGICSKFKAPKTDANAEDKARFEFTITAPKVTSIAV
jgi:hypothetical protein